MTATGVAATRERAAASSIRGKVAFVRYSVKAGRPRIYSFTFGRRAPKPLRLPGLATQGPAWSPDGRSLAFIAGRSAPDSTDIKGNADLYIWKSGSGARRLTRQSSRVGAAAWSPDGSRLVYVRQTANGSRASLWVVDVKSKRARRLTNGSIDLEPSWASDGRTIAFLRIDPKTYQSGIRLVRPDGSGLRRILPGLKNVAEPVWSPHGTRLLVQDGRAIYSVRRDGSGRRTIATLSADAQGALEDPQPAWSPDGQWVVFCQFRSGSVKRSDIWLVRADGTQLRRLTRSPGLDTDPSWAHS